MGKRQHFAFLYEIIDAFCTKKHFVTYCRHGKGKLEYALHYEVKDLFADTMSL
jgi:hypothetical protein